MRALQPLSGKRRLQSPLSVLRKERQQLPAVLKSVNQGASEIHLCVNSTHFFTTEKLLWINISGVQQGSAALGDIWFRLRSVCGIIIE